MSQVFFPVTVLQLRISIIRDGIDYKKSRVYRNRVEIYLYSCYIVIYFYVLLKPIHVKIGIEPNNVLTNLQTRFVSKLENLTLTCASHPVTYSRRVLSSSSNNRLQGRWQTAIDELNCFHMFSETWDAGKQWHCNKCSTKEQM